jgi:hypothetical protein
MYLSVVVCTARELRGALAYLRAAVARSSPNA